MTDNKSWKRLYPSYTEPAIGLIRECVAILRSRGIKTDAALRDLEPALKTTRRRVRTLFHRDRDPIVLKNEWMSLRYRVGIFFLNEAQRLRKLADRYEEAGESLVADQLEFAWGAEWQIDGSQRRSA